MKKKLLSLALALAMCLGLTAPAIAAGETTIQDSGGFSYALSKPVVGTRVDEQYGITYYQITEGTIITPVLPEGTVNKVSEFEGLDRLSYILPNEEVAVFYDVGTIYPYLGGGFDTGMIGDLEGMLIIEEGTPTQPLPIGEEYCITRIETLISEVSGQGASYLYLEIVPDSGSAVPTTVGGFTDVKTGDYFAEPVQWAVEKKVTAGTSATTFSPNSTCTQGQILTFLWRAKGEPKPVGTVSGTQYYAVAAQWAKEQGLTDNFSAEADCTRAMVVTYLWKLAGSPKTGTSNFSDVFANADYAQAVAWAVEQGVTAGTSATTFSPDSVCTRGQIVTFLYRGLAK